MRTISRSKRTVVVSVSCEKEVKEPQRHTTQTPSRTNVLFRSCNIEGKRERVNLVVSAELRPGSIQAGLGHQSLKRHIGTAAEFFQIRARRDQELRQTAVIIVLRQDVERMRVN